MAGYFKRKARKFSVSPTEEHFMALGMAYLYPSTYFVGQHNVPLELSRTIHESDDLRSLPKLEWRAGSEILGYIQYVTVDMNRKTAEVGHFAVAKNYSGMGFGKRMAQGFAKLLKDNYGVTEIIFDEHSRKTDYEVFFQYVLRAERIGTSPNEKWRWAWVER